MQNFSLVSSRSQKILEGLILALLTLVVYLFTINPLTKPYAIYALVLCLALLGIINFVFIKFVKKPADKLAEKNTFRILIFTITTAVLLWVGSTGWFLSPFFYLLYLLAISLGFLFSTSVSFSFILVLIGVLLPNIGSISSGLDLVSLLSLLLMVPLSYFLRREYLRRIEREKKILILQEEHKTFENKVEEILSNKVSKIATDLREPLNDIKQLAIYIQKTATKNEKEKIKRVINSSEKALQKLKDFEEETTGKILVETKQ